VLTATALLALTLAADFGQPAPPPAGDEARIEALVAAEHAQHEAKLASREEEKQEAEELGREHAIEQFPPAPRTPIAFDDLEKMKGRGILVHTVAGRTRTGEVQEVGRDQVRLRARYEGGYAEFTLTRKQISDIEAQ
jgi:hypothetical protein